MEDNHFTELKETEIMRERLQLLGEIDAYVGKYYSQEWVRKNVLRMSEEDIEDIEKQIKDEESEGTYDDEDQDSNQQLEPEDEPDETEEEFIPAEMSQEEKDLIERMTQVFDDVLEEE